MKRHMRLFRIPCLFLATSLVGCAGEDPTPDQETIDNASLWVSAQPRTGDFDSDITVRLLSERPSKIFYTLDGSPPTGEDALEYTEPLTFSKNALLMFVAVDPNGVWSKPQKELYQKNIIINPRPLDYALWYDKTILYYEPSQTEAYLDQTLEIESQGMLPVRISRISIGPNPEGAAFWQPGAFELLTPLDEVVNLAPREVLTISVRYHTTETIRSASVVIESNDERVRQGIGRIPLWGRLDH